MDIRCGSCNKLFRVADDKVTGKGIRFKCSRCGEIITVIRDEAASPPSQAPAPDASSAAPPPVAPPAPKPHDAAAPPAGEFQAREYQPPVPPTAMDDFDFSEPHAAAAAGGQQEKSPGGDAFSFEATAPAEGQEAGAAVGRTIPDEEEQQAGSAFPFPSDTISEPAPKPVLASAPAASEEAPVPSLDVDEQTVPDLTITEAVTPEPAEKAPMPAREVKPAGPPSGVHQAALAEEGKDLDQERTVPDAVVRQSSTVRSASAEGTSIAGKEEPYLAKAGDRAATESIHPLASGNVTGAIAGLGCSLPVVLLALFAFTLTVRFVPFFSVFPRAHLLAVIGMGLMALSVMTGIVIAVVQAQTGRKLFFLLNILIGAAFGTFYGAGMNAVTSVASGAGLQAGGIIAGAVAGGVIAFLVSILITIARRIMIFSKDESFAAPISGPQKAGVALSLVVILASLYAEGTLVGSMDKASREMEQQLESEISPDGLSVQNAQGYVDQATGDLVITGAVQNGLDAQKEAWYLEVDVFDPAQKVLSTIRMLNGVQLFDQRELEILAKREGKNADELKAAMIQALQGGAIPAKGSVNFEMRLPSPPPGIASFYPAFRRFSFSEAAGTAAGVRP